MHAVMSVVGKLAPPVPPLLLLLLGDGGSGDDGGCCIERVGDAVIVELEEAVTLAVDDV